MESEGVPNKMGERERSATTPSLMHFWGLLPTCPAIYTYNLPTGDEIALVKLDDSIEPGDVQIHLRGGGVKRINHMNKESDCLHYTLLFPQGQGTWHKELKNSQGQKITSAVFYRHLFQVFKDSFNGLLRYDLINYSLKLFVYFYVSVFQVWQADAGVCLHLLVQD